MELTRFLAALAVFLPIVYGAPTQAANDLHPEILAAMKRDLGLDAEQAHVRVARELKATEVIEQLRTSAGDSFSGAWLVDGELNVAITDEALTSEVIAAGAGESSSGKRPPHRATSGEHACEQGAAELHRDDHGWSGGSSAGHRLHQRQYCDHGREGTRGE